MSRREEVEGEHGRGLGRLQRGNAAQPAFKKTDRTFPGGKDGEGITVAGDVTCKGAELWISRVCESVLWVWECNEHKQTQGEGSKGQTMRGLQLLQMRITGESGKLRDIIGCFRKSALVADEGWTEG